MSSQNERGADSTADHQGGDDLQTRNQGKPEEGIRSGGNLQSRSGSTAGANDAGKTEGEENTEASSSETKAEE